ncbi:DUF308 domain-containing protein [Dactylosporangium sp. NPDC048998]|uniref:DUF308 domain-containing protein n=1 Tax=Dactylosporangium sp. NPDC048998 TaxID=3363976 RepID=UPI003717578C
MAFGIAVLAWPQATLRLLGVLAGVWLLAIGLMRVAGAFRGRGEGHGVLSRRVVDGVFGLLLVVVGVVCLREVAVGMLAVSVLVGLAWVLSGMEEMLLGVFAGGSTRV